MLKSPAIYIDRVFFCNNVKVLAKAAETLLQLETMSMSSVNITNYVSFSVCRCMFYFNK